MIEIYTDGAYDSVLGQGGWAAVVVESGQKHLFSGAARDTSSPRMEVTAVLEGIKRTPQGSEVVVYSDSQYVVGCMAKGWQRRANRDLWTDMDKLVSERTVKVEWLEQGDANPLHREAHILATNLTKKVEAAHPPPPAEGKPGEVATAGLTHIDAEGRPRMVDISAKADTEREAVARCLVRMSETSFNLLRQGGMPKGDVLSVAKLAGIMGAKQTPYLIPLCHPILIGDVGIDFTLDESGRTVEVTTRVKSLGKTGVEMEALTAAAVAALTIYDMCKAVDKGIRIESIRLVRKSGGKSGDIALE